MDKPYVRIAAPADIPPGTLKRFRVNGHDFLVANVDGTHYAVDDTCSHEDFSLSYGCLEGDRVKCSLHGSRFCLKTGQPQEEPADEPIGTYRLQVEDDGLWLDPSAPTNL